MKKNNRDKQKNPLRAAEELRKAHELAYRIINDGPVAIVQVDINGQIIEANKLAAELFGLTKDKISGQMFNAPEWGITDLDGSPFPEEKLAFRQVLDTGKAVHDVRQAIHLPDRARRVLSINGAPLHDEQGRINRVVFAIQDVTQQEEYQAHLRKIEWLLDKEAADTSSPEPPSYGDVTELSTERTIRDSVGLETLQSISSDIMTLLDTSLAVYEKNGDYAYGNFVSEWCSLMDGASRRLCDTDDNKEALSGGRWLCHEVCWNKSAKAAIESGEPTDIACAGGIRMYAAPIYAHDEVVGAINIGYGNPPTDNQTLSKLAEEYDTDIELLRQAALAFKPRPAFIVEAAKARVQIAAKQIGQMVEIHRAHAEIQKNKTLLDATARMAKVGGWELDVKTNEVKWTKETYRIHELPMDSKPLLEEAISFYHPEDRPILEQALREALNAGEPFDLQLRFTTVKGRDLVTRAICTPVLENGKVVHLQGTFQDITEQRRAEEALRESRETLRTTFKSIGDAVISTNTKAHVVSMNPVAESLTGWSEKDALGQPLETIFPIINERTRKPVESPVTKTLKRGCIVGLANHSLLLAKDGLETPIADSSAPIFNDTGEITGVVLVFRDQTEERAARKALESNLELLQIAGETAGFGGWVVDLEKDICILSDVVADIHDVPRGHTLSVQEGINFYAPEWLEKITEVFSACAEKGTPYDVELEIITKKGNRVWVRTCGRAVRNESGKIIKVQGSFQDITEQVETQIRFQMLFENMNTCVAIYRPRTDNSDFEFVDMNPIGLKYSRISREDIIGRNVTEVFPGVKKSGVFEVLQRVAETGKPEDIPATHYKDNRIELWVENHVFKLPSGLIVAVYEDITEQKKMQERVNHSEKMDAIGHLAGGIAHDFNNQLTGVLGFADMLVQQLDDPDLRQYAENIFAAAQRSKDLTMKLLAFSRKGQFQSVPIDTHKVINETIEILLHTIDKRIHIKQEFNADETTITGDPSSIQNALLNICVNARDAMPEGGTLAITTQVVEIDEPFRLSKGLDVEDGHYIEISVKDTGSGIPEDVMPHVFEPFYTTKSEGRGTGMGLSAVYGTVNKHGGDITLQSKVGEGTCFEIYLPLSSSDIEESSEDKNVEKENVSESLRILVVDDEDFVRNFECELLSTFGHSVLCAGNGKEAVELYRDEWPNIDLVILDMIMPKMGGKDAFREMKTINPEIKVILASGYSIDHEAQSILDEGAVGFVQKPFTVAQLLSEINLALS